jgi:hypothetical protein
MGSRYDAYASLDYWLDCFQVYLPRIPSFLLANVLLLVPLINSCQRDGRSTNVVPGEADEQLTLALCSPAGESSLGRCNEGNGCSHLALAGFFPSVWWFHRTSERAGMSSHHQPAQEHWLGDNHQYFHQQQIAQGLSRPLGQAGGWTDRQTASGTLAEQGWHPLYWRRKSRWLLPLNECGSVKRGEESLSRSWLSFLASGRSNRYLTSI